ncbi:retrovirus-related pol polyprotein from transposon TNT 1-94, partial [Tanacetum coccineum]
MSNTINNLKTQKSNALHNAIIEAGGKDCPPMLAPEGSSKTTTEGYMENYKNVSQDIQDQLNAEAKAVQIILTGIDNDIYSTVDACPNYTIFAQQQPVYHPQNHPNHYTQNSSTRSQPAATRNRGKAIVNSPPPTYDQEPTMVVEDDEMSKEKEIDKLMALISLSFKKIYKPTNNNLRTSSNTTRECQKLKRAKDAAYHKEKMLLFTPDAADNSGLIFDTEPLQKVQNDNDNYNVFTNDKEHPEQPESVNDTYMEEQGDTNITIDLLDMSTNGEMVDQDDDLAKERDLLASLLEKIKCEIEDFKTKNKSLESSNNHFKEANNELSKTYQLMFKDLKMFQAELDRYHDVNYTSKVAIDCVKAKGDLMSYKIESKKSFNEYTRKINDLNQTISEMKKELFAHQETISIMSQEKEAHIKFYKTHEDKEIEKVIALENKVKALDDIVYKTGQSVQTVNMLNHNCKTSFVKPVFLKKAQRANPHLYDIGCYNDNIALMLAVKYDETIRLAQESRSKLNDLIRPFDYKKLNNLYDLFIPQREKSPEQRYFSIRTKQPISMPISTREPKQTVNQSVATPLKRTVAVESTNQKPRSLVDIILFIVDSGCSKHMTGNLKLLTNFVDKFLGTVKFGNDQIALILGYGDLVQGNITIKRVYYVEGLKHNLFSVGQFCDADLEVAFRKSICYIRDLKGNDLLTGSRGTNLYSITFQDTSTPNPICLMAKASSSQAWLWHHRLLHLNFDTINLLSKYEIVTGLPKLKFIKDHLYSSYEWGERKTYTWTHFLRSKDETPVVLIDFLKLVQRRFHAQVRTVRTDKGTEFLNKTLHAYFAQEGIEHQMSTARTPEQNGVVKRRNRTLVEGARTMLNHVNSDPVLQCPTTALEQGSLGPGPQSQENVPQPAETVTMSNQVDLLFSLMFDELLNGTTTVVSKSS